MADCENNNLKEIEFLESTLETIDSALLGWIRDKNIHVRTKEGFRPVPVVWASAERAYQSKKHENLRDSGGSLIFPIISIQRTGIEKSLSKRLGIAPNTMTEVSDYRRGGLVVAKTINQEKTRNFANADGAHNAGIFRPLKCNNKIVYDIYSIPTPVYINVNYKVTFRSEYQQQINTLISPFISSPGGINEFMIAKDGHSYPAFVSEQFNSEDNLDNFTEEERVFQTTLDIRVLGYIIGAMENQESPKMVRRESVAEVRIPRERSLFGDLADYEENYGLGAAARALIAAKCCPPGSVFVPPRAFGSGAVGAADAAGVSINITNLTEINNIVEAAVADIIVVREFLQVGGGELDFQTSFRFKLDSETLYYNGLLQLPGANNDYVAWVGAPGEPLREGISIIVPPGGSPPRTAAEKAAAAGGDPADFEDDIILISYIKD